MMAIIVRFCFCGTGIYHNETNPEKIIIVVEKINEELELKIKDLWFRFLTFGSRNSSIHFHQFLHDYRFQELHCGFFITLSCQ